MRQEKRPLSAPTEKRATSSDRGDRKTLTERIAKYARQKRVGCQIGATLGDVFLVPKLENRLCSCGRYLAFRKYVKTGEVDLLCGNFCNVHLLCPACAAARAVRLRKKWEPLLVHAKESSDLYMLTLTWPPPRVPHAGEAGPVESLKENIKIGQKAWSKLWARRKVRGTGPLSLVLGAVLALEVTEGPAGWHPHFHAVVALPRGKRIDVSSLRESWCKYSGGRQIRLDPIKSERDLREVFKYAIKPADLASDGSVNIRGIISRFHIYRALYGSRLIRGYGCFHGVQDLEDLNTESEVEFDSDFLEFVDVFFRWSGAEYQEVSGYGLEVKNGRVRTGKYVAL